MDGMAQDLFGEAIIDGFHSSSYVYLSNFFPAQIVLWGEEFPTAEHAYQWSKTEIHEERLAILERHTSSSNGFVTFAPTTAGQAKRVGETVTLRKDWASTKYETMVMVLHAKFVQNPDLGQKLVETGDSILVEGNHWHDNYWGDCHCGRAECKAPGSNYLGLALMEVRSRLSK